ncbi:hypothetical protein ACFLS7_05835 [Bacteroidota bacterium]
MKNIYLCIILAASLIFVPSCKKFERLIAVRTISASSSTKQVRGEVIDVAESAVAYGFCWGTSSSPTLANQSVKVGTTSSPKSFETTLSSLQPGNTYYVRAYVSGEGGTEYGESLTVNIAGSIIADYVYDDGEADYGWRYNAGYEGWMGNYFPISSSGRILTIEMFFTHYDGHGNDVLNVDVFNSSQSLIGSTYDFMPGDDSWVIIDGENISFSGSIYVMVHWYYVTDPTNYLGMDQNGPDADMNLGFFRNSTYEWGECSTLTTGNQLPGNFLVRLEVELLSGQIVTYTSQIDPSASQSAASETPGTEPWIRNIKSRTE